MVIKILEHLDRRATPAPRRQRNYRASWNQADATARILMDGRQAGLTPGVGPLAATGLRGRNFLEEKYP